MNALPAQGRRGIRSYVLRQGRMTRGQRRALDRLYPRYGIEDSPAPLDLPALFGRVAPVWLELGFGSGATLAELALARPEIDFLGVEVHAPGVGHLLQAIEESGIENLRVARCDGVELLRQRIAPAALARILVLFPDPWHKKRHHKRRLVQAGFLDLLATRLAPAGELHLATDWDDYGAQMRAVIDAHPRFELVLDTRDDDARPAYRRRTRFESRGLRLGHPVRDLVCRLRPADG